MPISRFVGMSPVAGIQLAVYLQGTHSFATIYADAALTPLGNPFTVDGATGVYVFYADDAIAYDLNLNLAGDVPLDGEAPWQGIAQQAGGNVVGPASAVDDRIATFDGVTGELIQDGGSTIAEVIADAVAAVVGTLTFGILLDGQGSVITTGVKGYLRIPVACTITSVTLLSIDAAGPATVGSLVLDLWKDAYANYPPIVGDTIVASAPPTLSAARKSVDITLTGWTTAIAAGDVIGFSVTSAATVTKVIAQLTASVP